MNNVIIPAMLKKEISFIRLSSKNCSHYEIYAQYEDSNYASGTRTELLDTVENPTKPNPVLTRIPLEPVVHPTWELPKDIYMDADHKFYIYQNDILINPMCFKYNRITRLVTMDEKMNSYSLNDKMEIQYYRDIIELSYVLEHDCTIKIKPIFKQTATFGDHNIII